MTRFNWLDQPIKRKQNLWQRCWQAAGDDLPDLNSLEKLDKAISQGKKLKDDRTTTVVEIQHGDKSFIIKRYNARSRWHWISRSVRRTRASRSWQMSYAFAKAGIAVSQPILMFESRIGFLRGDAFFVSRKLDGPELLTALPTMPSDEQRLVVEAMQQSFDKLQKCRLSHGDMKATNLIWDAKTIYFIDLDAAQRHKSESSWARSHNKDRRRFIKNWRGIPEVLKLFASLAG